MQQLRIGLLATAIAVVATQASAQQIPWDDRIFANISFGVQGGSSDLTGTQTFPLYDETATITSSREVKGGSMFDLVVGGRVRGPFGVALGYTRRQKGSPGNVEASIPSPVRFEDPRIVSLTVDDLAHRERWVTPMIVWFQPLGESLDLMLMAGPAFASVETATITGATVTEGSNGPILAPTLATANESAVGISIGADVRYLFTTNLGVGGFVRFARAGVDVAEGQSLDIGGLQAGMGIRIRF